MLSKDVKTVVDHISLEVKINEFLVILGPGQCGKSIFLNMMAGLLAPTSGEIYIDDERLKGPDRRIGMVFQEIGLMPWLTVMKNVEIGLRYAGITKEDRRPIAQRFIDLVGLTGFEKSYPHQLSGGMKQRVGIARAYTANPEVLLMDEPFGQLDAQTRYAMQDEILRVWNEDKRTVVFVTNNIEEALYLGDRIILFSKGPAVVKAEYDLSFLPRPRKNTDPEFLKLRKIIANNTDLDIH